MGCAFYWTVFFLIIQILDEMNSNPSLKKRTPILFLQREPNRLIRFSGGVMVSKLD